MQISIRNSDTNNKPIQVVNPDPNKKEPVDSEKPVSTHEVQAGHKDANTSLPPSESGIQTKSVPIAKRKVEEKQIVKFGAQEPHQDVPDFEKFSGAILSETIVQALKLQNAANEAVEELKKTVDKANQYVKDEKKKSVVENVGDLSKRTNDAAPLQLALAAITERLPLLWKAYQAIKKDTPEAKFHFVQLCKSEMSSALLNQELTGEAFTTLKSDVSMKIAEVWEEKTDAFFVELLKETIKQVKDATAVPEAMSKLDRLYSLLQSLKIPAAVSLIYTLASVEGALMEKSEWYRTISPRFFLIKYLANYLDIVLNFILTAPTVPVLCFIVYYLLCYLVKLKAHYYPVADNIKQQQQQDDLLRMIAAKV